MRSEVGHGSQFWVEIPLIAADPAALPQSDAKLDIAAFQWLSGVRALVVDDSEMNLDVAFNILQRQGAEVSLCMNGQQALDWLATHAPAVDIVLMDMQMPVMDGFTATRHMREDARLNRIPVIAFTAGALASQKEQALASGASAFLTKPVDPQQLIATMRAELERRTGVPPQARLLDAQDFAAGQCFDALAPALRAHIGATLFDELAGRMAELDFKGAGLLLGPYGAGEKDLPP